MPKATSVEPMEGSLFSTRFVVFCGVRGPILCVAKCHFSYLSSGPQVEDVHAKALLAKSYALFNISNCSGLRESLVLRVLLPRLDLLHVDFHERHLLGVAIGRLIVRYLFVEESPHFVDIPSHFGERRREGPEHSKRSEHHHEERCRIVQEAYLFVEEPLDLVELVKMLLKTNKYAYPFFAS